MIDGVTILNEIEVVRVVNDTFNSSVAMIALGITVLICAVVGFFLGRFERKGFSGTMMGVLVGVILSPVVGASFGVLFEHSPVTKTTMRYEVILDDSVSLTEFNEHYNIIEQRDKIFVVEEKPHE